MVTDLVWSEWVALRVDGVHPAIPARPGLYRIRTDGDQVLDYVGQTGTGSANLRRRIAMLKGMWAAEMPYRDPHTAGPAMWASLRSGRSAPEVSVAVIEASTPIRKGLESLVISEHRWTHRRSPRWNLGRMPLGYRISSANNARLVAAGTRYRGGPSTVSEQSHEPGIAPLASIGSSPEDLEWGGLTWSPWQDLAEAIYQGGVQGLYRLRSRLEPGLVYVGEGQISSRLIDHIRKAAVEGHRQARLLADTDLTCSWVGGDWPKHHRLELENDLIANHVFQHGLPPAAQFLG